MNKDLEKDKEDGKKDEKPAEHKPAAPPLVISAQYVKDLSFEAPGLPSILFDIKEMPSLDINIDIKADHLKDDKFEVALTLKVHAKTDEKAVFICELVYGALAAINVPKEHLEPIILIEVPRMIFPFARQIIADVTKESGFTPVVLAPIDFYMLYRQRLEAQAEKEAKAAKMN